MPQQSFPNDPSYDPDDPFPNMRPIKSAPSLHTINGIGTAVYGARDHDAETGTYVKTHCFCFLFVNSCLVVCTKHLQ